MKKILSGMVAVVMAISGLVMPMTTVYADGEGDASTSTTSSGAVILTDCWDKASGENGKGIMCVLKIALDILTVGIGILGVLGIVIVGIQYLTAGGNEEQTRKAKRRMFEIVIGLVAYVLLYALLNWLLPGGLTTV